jgi:hypothetical protein
MFDVKTMKLIKTIEVPDRFSADGIYCDTSSDRVYIGSHPTKSLLVGHLFAMASELGRHLLLRQGRRPDRPRSWPRRRDPGLLHDHHVGK